ncbi:hypothetical protein [Rhizobium sp.]
MEPRNDTANAFSADDRARDPATLSFIERISWFECQRPIEADNDNATAREEGDACFQSWAMPDYMRR